MIANSAISKSYRHSFSAGVYEVSIALYTTAVTLLALINPKLGKFNVTDKGTNLDIARFDYRTSWPTLTLLAITTLGLMIAFPVRLLVYGHQGGDPADLDAMLINSVWALANFVTLIAAACVAYERPQHRIAPRVRRSYPCTLVSEETAINCRSEDLSESGVRLTLDRDVKVPEKAKISVRSDFGVEADANAVRVWSSTLKSGDVQVAFRFVDNDSETHRQLVQLMFSGDRSWIEQSYPKDRVWRSFWYLITTFWRISAPSTRS
jgi:cellulose synthase (UDP-forming)